jgi:hypothetical protein
MARQLTGFISENDCIGDSLDSPGGINPNFLALDEAVQSLSAYDTSLRQAITPTSNNLAVSNILSVGASIRTNTIQNLAGTNLFVNGYPRQPGQIIEKLTGLCNGSQITVGSGTYTMPTVTGFQDISVTRVDVTGSLISYTPPTGTSRVIYEFEPVFSYLNADPIGHFSLFIDGTEVLQSRVSQRLAGSNPVQRMKYTWIIPIGGTSDTANSGRQSTWTSPKELKLRARSYDSVNYRFRLHSLAYWDGAAIGTLAYPLLTITSIA